jgi:uncharacterized membrane protein
MPEPKSNITQEQMEKSIGILLKTGVITAALVVLAGGILYLVRHGTALPDYRVFNGEPEEFKSVSGIILGVWSIRARAWIQLGLLILIATPVARVAFSILAFALQRDRIYVIVTILVFAVLIFSLLGRGL